MNSVTARVSRSKKTQALVPCYSRGIAVELVECIESRRVQYIEVGRPRGWWRPGENPRATAPGDFASKKVLMGWT
jgi:hypothetical protein